jgi:photosystem II stability/assembly factor-like uncharacterized protein
LNCTQLRRYAAGVLLFVAVGQTQAHAGSWFPFGPDGGDARAFAADPQDHTHLYLGTTNGWVYESHDGGKHWARLARVGKRDDLIIKKILVDPANSHHLLVGAYALGDHPDGGLFVSSDSGETWITPGEMRGQSIRSLTVAPSDPKIMVAGSLDGVFRSTDSGAHWQLISPEGDKEIHEIESLAIDPTDPNTIFAGTWHLPWKTTDGGEKWLPMKEGIIEDSDIFSIILDPKQPERMFLSACSGIYKSEDAGAKFSGGVTQNKAQGIPSSARRTRVLIQDPAHLDTIFAGTTQGLYRTDDGGKFWMAATGADVIINDVYVDPTDNAHVLLATDRGGVLASDDGGSTFTPSNRGFQARQITAYAADFTRTATVYVGVVNDKEWGGVFVSHTGGQSWSQLPDGLEGHDIFSLGQAPDGSMLAGTGHGIYRLKGTTWERTEGKGIVEPRSLQHDDDALLPLDPDDAVAQLTGDAKHLAKPRMAPAKAQPAKPDTKGFNGSVYAFALSGNTVFAGTSDGMLRSADSGLTWKAIQSLPLDDWRPQAAAKSALSLPPAEWRFIAVAKLNVVAASLDTIVFSSDAGTTWQPVQFPPEVTQVNAASIDGAGTIWIGGRQGAFFTRDKGATWESLPGVPIRNSNSIFYDARTDRVLLTSSSSDTVTAVQMPAMKISFMETGWSVRFVRPMADHLLAVTPFDGIVVQPRMVDSAEAGTTTAQR